MEANPTNEINAPTSRRRQEVALSDGAPGPLVNHDLLLSLQTLTYVSTGALLKAAFHTTLVIIRRNGASTVLC